MKLSRNLFLGAMLLGTAMFFMGCSEPCEDVTCLNGGTCDEETAECVCAAGYEGSDCGVAVNAKFVGTWNFSENCTSNGQRTFPLAISAVAGSLDSLEVTGIWNDPSYSVKAVILSDGLSIKIHRQIEGFIDEFESSSATISSDGSTLNIQYSRSNPNSATVGEVCSGVGVR